MTSASDALFSYSRRSLANWRPIRRPVGCEVQFAVDEIMYGDIEGIADNSGAKWISEIVFVARLPLRGWHVSVGLLVGRVNHQDRLRS